MIVGAICQSRAWTSPDVLSTGALARRTQLRPTFSSFHIPKLWNLNLRLRCTCISTGFVNEEFERWPLFFSCKLKAARKLETYVHTLKWLPQTLYLWTFNRIVFDEAKLWEGLQLRFGFWQSFLIWRAMCTDKQLYSRQIWWTWETSWNKLSCQ